MDYLAKGPGSSIGGIQRASLRDAENTPVQERKPSHTECALKELEGQHGRVDALISELERRLAPVLLSAPPTQSGAQAEGSMSPLAGKLTNEAELVRGLAERLDSIISRIDV